MPAALLLITLIVVVLAWRALVNHRAPGAARPGYRFVAPDDDPDFIRELHRRTREADDEPS